MTEAPPSDWVVPDRTIIVAALQRSGSNLLSEYMTQTDRLGRPGEFFNSHVLRAVYPGRGKTIEDRCRLVREMGTSPNGVVGIKMFPEHYPTPRTGIRFSQWFGKPVWVRLRRRDLLGQAISFVLARQQHAFVAHATPKFVPEYSADDISRTITEFCIRDGRWTAYFARTGQQVLEVTYEEIERDADSVLSAIANAAGIDLGGYRLAPPSTFKKQRTSLNDEWRARFISERGDPDIISAPREKVRGWLGELLHRRALKAID